MTLGATIVVAVAKLFDWRAAVHVWKVRVCAARSCVVCCGSKQAVHHRSVTPSRYCTLLVLLQLSRQDFVVYMAALLFTLGLGIEEGILIACGLGLALVLRETTKPHWARLQRVVRYQ